MLPGSCRGRLCTSGSMVNHHAGTLQALAVPPTVMLGALVKHFAAPRDGMLAASIAEEMRVPYVGHTTKHCQLHMHGARTCGIACCRILPESSSALGQSTGVLCRLSSQQRRRTTCRQSR